jgi:putative transposase
MSRKHKIRTSEGIYFISFSVVYWKDVFIRNEYKNIFIESLKYCQENKGLRVQAWVIMTSHVHLIVSTEKDKLEGIICDFKSFTSRKLKEAIKDNIQESRRDWIIWMMERAGKQNKNNKGWQFWQQHNKPIELWDNYMLDQKLNYLPNNPVESGFVLNAKDYLYSSVIDYADGKGLLEITKIE